MWVVSILVVVEKTGLNSWSIFLLLPVDFADLVVSWRVVEQIGNLWFWPKIAQDQFAPRLTPTSFSNPSKLVFFLSRMLLFILRTNLDKSIIS